MQPVKNLQIEIQHVIFGFILSLSMAFPVFSQIALDGTVDVGVNEYAGRQPGLIDGVRSVPASGNPLVRHVYMARQDVIGVVIDEKACILSNLKPYRKQGDDRIVMNGYHRLTKLLLRDGDPLGYINGRQNNWYRPFNEMAGQELDTKRISDPSRVIVSSPDHQEYSSGTHPLDVFRKSVPNESVSRLRYTTRSMFTLRHYLYLKLPSNLLPGKHYEVTFQHQNESVNRIQFLFDDRELRSEAIHVNLYGYEPEDKKVAFLSSWMGDGGGLTYPGDLHFRVVNQENNQTVYEGKPKRIQSAGKPDYTVNGKEFNHYRTDVYRMDFSQLDESGRFRLVVDGIGSSFEFLIQSRIWENTTRLLMKGFFHQRAGIELGPPYTKYIRPRNLHPEDGHPIRKCDPETFYETEGEGNFFEPIQASIQKDTSVPEAWGGWMDAGDFDRRMKHFYTVRRMMYLYELNSDYFEHLQFNIPESSNEIPDLLDEALWCLELFRRTQGVYEKGAVSWKVESIEHPRQGETSWTNSLPTALVPPTPEAGVDYAGTAAHMSLLLKPYNKELAEKYKKSALDAMEWVEAHPDVPTLFLTNERRQYIACYAYANLYRLTGDETWHQRFQTTLNKIFPDGIKGHLTFVNDFHSVEKIDAVATYALMDSSDVRQKLQKKCRNAIVAHAEELVGGAREVTNGTFRMQNRPLFRMATMPHRVLPVVLAHEITGNEQFVNALTTSIQYTMGSNPMNRSFISGLGERSFAPYHHDWHTANLPIPAGLPNFGPLRQKEEGSWGWSSDSVLNSLANGGLYPQKLFDWPMSEKCFNQMWHTPTNEFMVQIPMGELLLISAYLAGH